MTWGERWTQEHVKLLLKKPNDKGGNILFHTLLQYHSMPIVQSIQKTSPNSRKKIHLWVKQVGLIQPPVKNGISSFSLHSSVKAATPHLQELQQRGVLLQTKNLVYEYKLYHKYELYHKCNQYLSTVLSLAQKSLCIIEMVGKHEGKKWQVCPEVKRTKKKETHRRSSQQPEWYQNSVTLSAAQLQPRARPLGPYRKLLYWKIKIKLKKSINLWNIARIFWFGHWNFTLKAVSKLSWDVAQWDSTAAKHPAPEHDSCCGSDARSQQGVIKTPVPITSQ